MLDNETQFKKLMIKAQNGDSIAYNLLLNQLLVFLKNYLNKRIYEKHDIEEICQDILLAVHKSLHTYDDSKSFMSWLLGITEYKIIDYIRAKKNKSPGIINTTQNIPHGSYNEIDGQIDTTKAFDKLSKNERDVLFELKIKGQSISDTSKKLNLTTANVKVIAHRAYLNLKKQLGVDS